MIFSLNDYQGIIFINKKNYLDYFLEVRNRIKMYFIQLIYLNDIMKKTQEINIEKIKLKNNQKYRENIYSG